MLKKSSCTQSQKDTPSIFFETLEVLPFTFKSFSTSGIYTKSRIYGGGKDSILFFSLWTTSSPSPSASFPAVCNVTVSCHVHIVHLMLESTLFHLSYNFYNIMINPDIKLPPTYSFSAMSSLFFSPRGCHVFFIVKFYEKKY